MKLNENQLVCTALNTCVDHPRSKGYYVGYDGKGRICMSTGGITYSHAIGDPCMQIAGDHVEPGVSMANKNQPENNAVQAFSCIGNEVRILNGEAKGAKGYVTGTHGGVDHTMAWFAPEVLEQMSGNEQFLIKARGLGLKMEDHPDIQLMSIDPELFKALPLKETEKGIEWPVAAIIPAFLLGSGLGVSTILSGDYDIMSQDPEANQMYGINDLRFGDFVAIQDHDSAYGPHYKEGAVTIGVICHSDSFTSGHGPGVTVVASAPNGEILPVLDEKANLKTYMDPIWRKRIE